MIYSRRLTPRVGANSFAIGRYIRRTSIDCKTASRMNSLLQRLHRQMRHGLAANANVARELFRRSITNLADDPPNRAAIASAALSATP